MRINNFQYEVMSAKRYPLTPYGDIIILYMYFYRRVKLIIPWWVSIDNIVSKITTHMPLRIYLAKRL